MNWRVVKALSVLAACALTVACVSAPPAEPATEPMRATLAPVPPASPHPAFEQRQRERALNLTRDGRLADAAVAWEVLIVLRPDVGAYRERLDDVKRQIDSTVAEHLPRAAQAARRGEIDGAMQLYLGVLAVEPDHAKAADALRALERERVKRNFVGKYTRYTLTRRSISDGEMKYAPKLEERNELEHASMLAGQGDFDDAIALLEQRLKSNPREPATQRLLADLYFQKVQAQPGLDKAAAIRWLERSVQLDPRHAAAKARLWQLKSDQCGAAGYPGDVVRTGRLGISPGALIPPSTACLLDQLHRPLAFQLGRVVARIECQHAVIQRNCRLGILVGHFLACLTQSARDQGAAHGVRPGCRARVVERGGSLEFLVGSVKATRFLRRLATLEGQFSHRRRRRRRRG